MGIPVGLPLYWRNETSGTVAAAVQAYLADQTGGLPISDEHIELLKTYLDQWISASCWDSDSDSELLAELHSLRERVKLLKTADEIHWWLMDALDLGMDPL